MSETVDTRNQQVVIKTRRGNLRVGPGGQINGLWQIVRRELRTNAQVRQLAGGVQRSTLINWRKRETDPFPTPVLHVAGQSGPVELWSRTEVEQWLARRASGTSE